MDQDEGGQALFDEISQWALKKRMRVVFGAAPRTAPVPPPVQPPPDSPEPGSPTQRSLRQKSGRRRIPSIASPSLLERSVPDHGSAEEKAKLAERKAAIHEQVAARANRAKEDREAREQMRATLLHAQLLNTSAAPEAEPLLRALRRSRGEGGEAEAEAEAYRAWFAHLPALDPGPGETDPGEAAAAVEFVGGGGGGSSTHDEL